MAREKHIKGLPGRLARSAGAGSPEAIEMARAVLAAKALPSGVTLTQVSNTIALTVDLEEHWIEEEDDTSTSVR